MKFLPVLILVAFLFDNVEGVCNSESCNNGTCISGDSCSCDSGSGGVDCSFGVSPLTVGVPILGITEDSSDYAYFSFTPATSPNPVNLAFDVQEVNNTCNFITIYIALDCGGCVNPFPRVGSGNYHFYEYGSSVAVPYTDVVDDVMGADMCACATSSSPTWYVGITAAPFSSPLCYFNLSVVATDVCSGHGTWTTFCTCDVGWSGDDCSQPLTLLTSTATGSVANGELHYYYWQHPLYPTERMPWDVYLNVEANGACSSSGVYVYAQLDCGGCSPPWPTTTSFTERITGVPNLISLLFDTIDLTCGCTGGVPTWYFMVQGRSSAGCDYRISLAYEEKCNLAGNYSNSTRTCTCLGNLTSDRTTEDRFCTEPVARLEDGVAQTFSIDSQKSAFVVFTPPAHPHDQVWTFEENGACSNMAAYFSYSCGDAYCEVDFITGYETYASYSNFPATKDLGFTDHSLTECGCLTAQDPDVTWYARLKSTHASSQCNLSVSVDVADRCATNDTKRVCSGGGACVAGVCACDAAYMGLDCSLSVANKWWNSKSNPASSLASLANRGLAWVRGDDDVSGADATLQETYNKIQRGLLLYPAVGVQSMVALSETNDQVNVTVSVGPFSRENTTILVFFKWDTPPTVHTSVQMYPYPNVVTTFDLRASVYDHMETGLNLATYILPNPVDDARSKMLYFTVYIDKAYEFNDIDDGEELFVNVEIEDATGTALDIAFVLFTVLLICCVTYCGGRAAKKVSALKDKIVPDMEEPEIALAEKAGNIRVSVSRQRKIARKYISKALKAKDDGEGQEKVKTPPALPSPGLHKGDRVSATWQGGSTYYNGVIDVVNGNNTFAIKYDDGDFDDAVPREAIRFDEEGEHTASDDGHNNGAVDVRQFFDGSSSGITTDYTFEEGSEPEEPEGGGCASPPEFVVLLVLRAIGLCVQAVKVFFNLSMLHASFGFFVRVPSLSPLKARIPFGNLLLALSDLYAGLSFGVTRVIDWNCGGVVALASIFVMVSGVALLVIVIAKDLLLWAAISLGKYQQRIKIFRNKLGGMVFSSVSSLFVALLFYLLQTALVAISAIITGLRAQGRTCSNVDFYMGQGASTVNIIVMVIGSLIMFYIFSGKSSRNWSKVTCGIPLYFLDAIHRLVLMTLGVWTNLTTKSYEIIERAEQFDDNPLDNDNMQQKVIALIGKSRGLVWLLVPFLIVFTKVAEQANDPPIFLLTTADTGLILRVRWQKRLVQWINHHVTLLFTIITAITASFEMLLLTLASLLPVFTFELLVDMWNLLRGNGTEF